MAIAESAGLRPGPAPSVVRCDRAWPRGRGSAIRSGGGRWIPYWRHGDACRPDGRSAQAPRRDHRRRARRPARSGAKRLALRPRGRAARYESAGAPSQAEAAPRRQPHAAPASRPLQGLRSAHRRARRPAGSAAERLAIRTLVAARINSTLASSPAGVKQTNQSTMQAASTTIVVGLRILAMRLSNTDMSSDVSVFKCFDS